MTDSELDTILTFNPDTGAPTNEPNLDQIIFMYYRQHMDYDQASICANLYIEKLKEEVQKCTKQ